MKKLILLLLLIPLVTWSQVPTGNNVVYIDSIWADSAGVKFVKVLPGIPYWLLAQSTKDSISAGAGVSLSQMNDSIGQFLDTTATRALISDSLDRMWDSTEVANDGKMGWSPIYPASFIAHGHGDSTNFVKLTADDSVDFAIPMPHLAGDEANDADTLFLKAINLRYKGDAASQIDTLHMWIYNPATNAPTVLKTDYSSFTGDGTVKSSTLSLWPTAEWPMSQSYPVMIRCYVNVTSYWYFYSWEFQIAER
jgi:hypothetical protein